jgi:hypothetical protein
MPASPSSLLLVFATFSASAALGCAGERASVPPGAHVELLQTQKLVLHGTAAANPSSASCADRPDHAAPQYLELKEDVAANVVLRPIGAVAVLHVQDLASSRTWCVMTRGDGTGATLPGEFPAGVYAISVQGSHSTEALPYVVSFERL